MTRAVGIGLPWPPSINRYWRSVRGRVLISREGREYRSAVIAAAANKHRFGSSRIAVEITANPPDRRRRDLDNLPKAVLDALAHAGVYDDDSQIDLLTIKRGPRHPCGWIGVVITLAEESHDYC